MSRSRHDVFALGLSASELALVRREAGGGIRTEIATVGAPAAQSASLKAAMDSLIQTAGVTSSQLSSVTLGAGTLRHFAMEPPAGIRSLGELRLVATGRCAQIFGGSPEDWAVTGDWRASGSFLCAALPTWVDMALRSCFPGGTTTPRVRSFVEAAFECMRDRMPSNGWVCIKSPAYVVLTHLTQSKVTACRTLVVGDKTADAWVGQVEAEINRYNLRLNLPTEEPLCSFDSREWLTAEADGEKLPDTAVAAEAGCVAWMGLRA